MNTSDDHQNLLDKIPDFEEYKKKLLDLRRRDLSGYSDEELKSIFFEHTIVHPYFFTLLQPEEFNESIFFRVRYISPGSEEIRLNRTFSYPSPSQCKENGRANKKGKSVFYASDYAIASILESKPNNGDVGFLSIWKPNAIRRVQTAVFLPKNIIKDNPWRGTSIELHNFLGEQTILLGKEKKPQIDLLNEFLCDQFIFEKKPYALTSWLSNELLYQYLGIELILYPSVITNSHFCNFAFHPNFVDSFLSLDKVYQFRIEEKGKTALNYSLGLIGFKDLTNIHWKEPTKEEADIFFGLIEKGLEKEQAKSKT